MAAPPDVPVRLDDAALIEQSWHRPDVFAVLYDRYFGEIHRYAAGRLGTQIADDLAAETFLVAFRKRQSFDPARGAVRPWLYGIATNLLAQYRRSETRRLEAFQRAPADDVADGGHEDRVTARVAAAGAQGRLATALGRLPDGDRDVLLLVALAELSYEEVAQTLDIPFGTVGSRLNRVRRKLRAALGGVNPMIGGSDG
ncbi:RNA polymerase sigma factor [Streptosporangium sp. NPDC003464]